MLKKSKKPKRVKLVPLPVMIKRADIAFSRYVRLRDSSYVRGQWVCECITCQRKMVTVDREGHWNPVVNAGHYLGRSNKGLRWTEENVNAQCARCNAWMDKVEMLRRYHKALCLKYGEKAVTEMEDRAHLMHKPTREELQQIIDDSKEYVNFTLANPEGIKESA